MAFLHFDGKYAPCGFLIVKDGCSPYDEKNTVLIQTDWDFPGVASAIGFVPKDEHNVSETISEAYDFLREKEGESFEQLDEYLTSE